MSVVIKKVYQAIIIIVKMTYQSRSYRSQSYLNNNNKENIYNQNIINNKQTKPLKANNSKIELPNLDKKISVP